MFTDIECLASDTTIDTDICIVGSGAAGIAIACEFIGGNKSVTVLEAGGRITSDENDDLLRSEIVGHRHDGIHNGRARVFGGTTVLWAGQAMPLFERDFEVRRWVRHSGWPIGRLVLEPYYRRAETVLGVDHVDNGVATWPSKVRPDYELGTIVSAFSQFSPKPNLARRYDSVLADAANVRIVLNANVTSLEASHDATSVKEVRAVSRSGTAIRVAARIVVICAGGIETARCLMLSDSVEPNGIGNRHDLVGRFFQDHPAVILPVKPANEQKFRSWTHSFRKGNIRYSLKMLPSDRFTEEKRILNVGAEVFYPPDEKDGLIAAKAVLQGLRHRHKRKHLIPAMAHVLADPAKVARAAYNYYVRRQPATVGLTSPHLDIFCEQEPNPDSRVFLSRDLDRNGLRRTALDWRIGAKEEETILRFSLAIKQEWNHAGIGDFDVDDLGSGSLVGRKRFRDYNHHIGTCRMGTDPANSVVDPDCRVHGYSNLYIGSSATFPTGGCSNPTLTIIALSLRIADRIKAVIATV